MLNADHILLNPEAHVAFGSDALQVDADEQRFTFSGIDAVVARRFLSHLDGTTPWKAVAEQCEISPDTAQKLVHLLVEYKLAQPTCSPLESVSGDDFAKICRRQYRVLKARLFRHPLWTTLGYGEASKSLFMGWLIENFHYIEGVNARLSMAAATCKDPRIKPFFVKHYVEEWDHSEFFLRALERLGVSRASAMASRPLPSTLAILHHMRNAARQDPIYYAACSGFLESTGEDHEGGRAFIETLERSYAAEAPGCLTPVIQHSELDEAYQHNSVVEDVCSQLPQISLERASGALTMAEGLVEVLELWSTDIFDSYHNGPFRLREGYCRLGPEPEIATEQ